jgi:hypothetical protein
MSAVVFIILRQYRNRIKNIFSKPLSAILTVMACLAFLSGLLVVFLSPNRGLAGSASMELVIAGIQLFIGLLLVNAFLSQQSGFFTLADANLLFSTPLSQRSILVYAALQTGPASLLTAIFMTFYFPFVVGKAMTPFKFLITILIMTLFFACIYLSYYYVYILDIAKPGLKLKIRRYLWLVILAFAVLFGVLLAANGFDIVKTASEFFTSPLYDAFPIFGWAKWGISAAVGGHYLTGLVPAVLLLGGTAALFAWLFFTSDVDFFEQALQDSIRVQKILDDVKSGNMDAGKGQLKKVRKARVRFGRGAAAVMSRQFLEMKKAGPLLTFRELIMGLAYIALGLVAKLDFTLVLVMVLFAILTLSVTDTWNTEFKRHYIYLIPENSFGKLIFSVLPGLVKGLISGVATIILAAVAYRLPFADGVASVAILVSFVALFVFAGVFTYRILGKQANAVVLMFLRMLMIMLAAVPGIILIVVIAVINGGNITLPAIAGGICAVNFAESCLLAFFGRGLFERSELMN